MSAHLCAEQVEGGPGAGSGRETSGNAGGFARAEPACPGGVSLDEYSGRVAEELHRRIDLQAGLVRQLLAGRAASGAGASCPLVSCPRLSGIEEALRETIDILEETRSAFKSKRLEVLRKKLIGILSGR